MRDSARASLYDECFLPGKVEKCGFEYTASPLILVHRLQPDPVSPQIGRGSHWTIETNLNYSWEAMNLLFLLRNTRVEPYFVFRGPDVRDKESR